MDSVSTQRALESALTVRRDIQAFGEKFPSPPSEHIQMPRFTWAQLQRQLTDLSDSSTFSADQILAVLEPLRAKAHLVPSELLLRELLVAISVLLEEEPTKDCWADH